MGVFQVNQAWVHFVILKCDLFAWISEWLQVLYTAIVIKNNIMYHKEDPLVVYKQIKQMIAVVTGKFLKFDASLRQICKFGKWKLKF